MSRSTKYYISKNGKFETLVPKNTYQTKTSLALDVYQSKPITEDSTIKNPVDISTAQGS